jgi:hypothetical protein
MACWTIDLEENLAQRLVPNLGLIAKGSRLTSYL